MQQSLLNRLVARATGETCALIAHQGFSIADPLEAQFDPEPSFDAPIEKFLDWDEVQAHRQRALLPA